jgi:hypothetical protein
MKQNTPEFECTYKLNLNDLKVKILQFKVQIWYITVLRRKLNDKAEMNLSMK